MTKQHPVRQLRRWVRRDQGAAAVEFALVLPLLLLLVLGIVDCARLYNTRIALSAAAAEGARALVASQPMSASQVSVSRDRADAAITAALRGSAIVGLGDVQITPCPLPPISSLGGVDAEALVQLNATAPLTLPLPDRVVPSITITGTGVRQCTG